MMCGLPSSGKTTYANQLKKYLEETYVGKNILIINDSMFCKDKNSVFMDPSQEKELRGSLKSEAQKQMSKEDVVILDSSNYIKGYRYELFCISKLTQTPQCVIFVNRPFEECIELNKKRSENEAYRNDVMDALNNRFEPPESKNRWDSVLFNVQNEPLPLEEIADVLFNRKAPPPNKSTLNKPLLDASSLHDIDKVTQEIITFILGMQANQLASNELIIPNATEKLKLIRPVNLAELRRWRQQFLTYIKIDRKSVV